jgi:hypothetical protein
MNTDVEVGFEEGGDGEKARIIIRSFGSVGELRFGANKLDAVAHLGPSDFLRMLEAIRVAEEKRVAPDSKLLDSVGYLESRLGYLDEDQTQLWIDWELVMPIAACGSVKLEPNFPEPSFDEEKA